MSNLRPCPFCGLSSSDAIIHAEGCLFDLLDNGIYAFEKLRGSWQSRPLEDALHTQCNTLHVEKDELMKVIRTLIGIVWQETDIAWTPSPKFREMFPEFSKELYKIQMEDVNE